MSYWQRYMLTGCAHHGQPANSLSQRSAPNTFFIQDHVHLSVPIEALTAKGDWDSQRQRLLSNTNLARVARESGLVDCMIVNPRNPVQASTRLAAALVEAIVGAVWVDSDESIDAVRKVMDALHLITLVSLMWFPYI